MVGTIAVACTVVALGTIAYLSRRSPAPHGTVDDGDALLFHGEELEHASGQTLATLDATLNSLTWASLHGKLSHKYPDLPAVISQLSEGWSVFADALNPDGKPLEVTRCTENTRVVLPPSDPGPTTNSQKFDLLAAEARTLRIASQSAPYPMWILNADGVTVWSNDAYDNLLATADPERPGLEKAVFDPVISDTSPRRRRAALRRRSDARTLWFDVSLEQRGTITIGHAVDIKPVIDAEVAQRNFVQTLAKTFAQLSTGLAIFDRNGQLALFNPALVDLTHLPAEFLSARPDLLSFFDRLREQRMMPEPKDYLNWRQEITSVIAAATDGRYQETWTLDTGQTYRVSGRPHPDGAVAFLIEDISAEILVTRNFREHLELGHSVMDTLADGLAVFSSNGVLSYCNKTYCRMWGLEPDMTFATFTVGDAAQEWRAQCCATTVWPEIEDFVNRAGDREPWVAKVETRSGIALHCHVTPVASGATLVRFERSKDQRATAPRIDTLVSD